MQIRISVEDGKHSLGGSIVLTANYLNTSDGSVSFREPIKMWEVKLQVIHNPDKKQEGTVEEVPFGRIFYYKRDDGLERSTIEEAETISLAPDEQYQFNYDVAARWPDFFLPGTNLANIIDLSDDDVTLVSNQIPSQVVYDESTFPILLATVSDKEAPIESREFAVARIKKNYPAFAFVVKKDVSVQDQDDNNKQLIQAQLWWQSHANDVNVKQLMETLNHNR